MPDVNFISKNIELWRKFDDVVARRDLFWIQYYWTQLSTAYEQYLREREESVIQY